MVQNRYNEFWYIVVSNFCDYTKIMGENIGFLINDIILTENKTNYSYEGT